MRFSYDNQWLQMSLQTTTARATATVSENSVTYANALPSVDVTYSALNDSLKDEIVLKGPDAPTTFSYDVQSSPGLIAQKTADGIVEFVDATGHGVFLLAPPFMHDASGPEPAFSNAVSMDVNATGAGWRLTVTADQEWIANPERQWPITIDPTIFHEDSDVWQGAEKDCYIKSGDSANTPQCGSEHLQVGDTGVDLMYSLLRFDLTSLPSNAQVLNAELSLYLSSVGNANTAKMSLHRVTQSWTNSVTWNTRPSYDAVSSYNHSGVGPNPGQRSSFYPTELVQSWANGTKTNDGMLLKATPDWQNTQHYFASSDATDPSRWPSLTVLHTPYGVGDRSFFTFEDFQLNDRMTARVNLGTGNLLVTEKDVQTTGTGLDLAIDRHYNSLTQRTERFGTSWVMGTGRDVGLRILPDGAVSFVGPSGYDALFFKKPDGKFRVADPQGVNAKLTLSSGQYKLTFHASNEVWTFSSAGYLLSRKDRNGNTIFFSYDASNRLHQTIDTQGRAVSFSYNANGQIETMTDVAGNRTYRYGYTSGRLTSYTDPENATPTTFSYTTSDGGITHSLSQITDPVGNVTKFTYDAQWRVKTVTRVNNPSTGAGDQWSFTYGTKTEVVDPRLNTTTYRADKFGRVTSVTDVKGHQRSFKYTPNSNVQEFTEPASGGGTLTTFLGWQVVEGGENLTSIKLPGPAGGEAITNFTYNDKNLPSKRTESHGTAYNYKYDSKGNLTGVTFDKGNPPVESGTRTCGTQPCWFTYAYTGKGTLDFMTDGRGVITDYGYDGNGNLTFIDHPAPIANETFTYDAVSRVKTYTDGNGQMSTFTYDNLDRVTRIDYADSSFIRYIYDGNGNLKELTDSTGTTNFEYDTENRMRKRTHADESFLTFTYDPVGNLATTTDGSVTVQYEYDNVNLVQKIIEPGGTTKITYDPDTDRPNVTTYPNGVEIDRDFDKAGRLKKIVSHKVGGPTYASFTYDYTHPTTGKETNLRYKVVDGTNNTTNYRYDELDRLSSAKTTNSSGVETDVYEYPEYDPNGNRKVQRANGTETTYTYNDANQLKTSTVGSTTSDYGYDANGNLTSSSAGFAAAYNAKNQTTSITSPGGNTLPMAYRGAPQDERVTAGSTSFNYGVVGLSSENTGGTTTYYVRAPNGNLVSSRTGTESRYYIFDGLGSVVGLTDSSGALVDNKLYKYDPFGKQLQGPTTTNPWRFASGYFDTETNLYKFGTRYYDANLGRWTQPDPIFGSLSDPLSLNRYLYVKDNPVNATDSSGRFIHDEVADVFGDLIDIGEDVLTFIAKNAETCLKGAVAGGPVGVLLRIGPVPGAVLGCIGAVGLKVYFEEMAERD